MKSDKHFYFPPGSAHLEVFNGNEWVSLCELEMLGLEPAEFNRLAIIQGMDSFEPVVYLRCANLSDSEAYKIQSILMVGNLIWCRLDRKCPLYWVEEFLFKLFNIREVYQCNVTEVSPKEPPSKVELKWMLTGFRFKDFPLPE